MDTCKLSLSVKGLILISIIACSLGEDFHLTILHTNDVHARFEESDEHGGPCTSSNCYGGVARRQTVINEIRESHENVLLLDAGDQFSGTLWFDYYQGNATQHFIQQLGYDVINLGNHEFDNGINGLVTYLKDFTVPVVSSNLDSSGVPSLRGLYSKSIVLNVGGRQIGVIGYVTELTPQLVNADGILGLEFRDIVESLQAEVDRLKARGVNIIIGLGHAGFEVDLKIAALVNDLDLIVGGYSNTFLYTGVPPAGDLPSGPYPTTVTKHEGSTAAVVRTQIQGEATLVVQAFRHGKYLGYLNLTFDDDGKVKSWAGNPILLDSQVEKDPILLAEVNTWKIPLDSYRSTELGRSLVYMEGHTQYCRLQECNMGNMVTDAMIDFYLQKLPATKGWANVSVAMWNAGAFANSIEKGTITLGSVVEAFPYQNTLEQVKLKGLTLLNILEHSVSKYDIDTPSGRFLQYSGMKVKYDITASLNIRVKSVHILCASCDVPKYALLDIDATYWVLMSDFMIQGGDGFTMIKPDILGQVSFGDLLTDVVTKYVKKYSPLKNGVEGRIEVFTHEDAKMVTPTAHSSLVGGVCSSADAMFNLNYLLLILTSYILISVRSLLKIT